MLLSESLSLVLIKHMSYNMQCCSCCGLLFAMVLHLDTCRAFINNFDLIIIAIMGIFVSV